MEFDVYSIGFCFASVCTSLEDEQATNRLNLLYGTGIESQWKIADEDFRDGTPNPHPCENLSETHRHILFEC
jgi:hypothetical protein